jgi:tetratricopeptide (TPR) repeat protein
LIAGRWYAHNGKLDRARALLDEAHAAAGADEDARAAIDWDRAQLGAAMKTADVLARAAVEYRREHPRSAYSVEALQVALLSGGLPDGERHAVAHEAVEAAHDDPHLLNDLTYLLLAAGEVEEARRAATRQVELNGTDANAHDTLAEALFAAGDQSGALAESDVAIQRADDADERMTYVQNRTRFARGDHTPSDVVARHRKTAAQILEGLQVGPAAAPAAAP